MEIEFGIGNICVETGSIDGGHPCVFIDKKDEVGVIGESCGEQEFNEDTIVLKFPTIEQALLVADALCNSIKTN